MTVYRRGFQGCFLWLGPLGWLVLYSSCLSSVLLGPPSPSWSESSEWDSTAATVTAFSLLIDQRVDQSRRETAQSLIVSAQGFGTIAGSSSPGSLPGHLHRRERSSGIDSGP